MAKDTRYIMVWTDDEEFVHTLIFHELPSSDPQYTNDEFTAIRTFTRNQIDRDDPYTRIVTSADKARE